MGTGRTPGNHVRYPGYDVLGQAPTWDAVTRGVVLRRLGPPAPVRFFTVQEEAVARPMLDRLRLVREALGEGVELYVDTNGAYDRKQAIRLGREFADTRASTASSSTGCSTPTAGSCAPTCPVPGWGSS